MSGDERICIRVHCGHTFNDHHTHGPCSICRCGDFIAQTPLNNCVRQGCFHPKTLHIGSPGTVACTAIGCSCTNFIIARDAFVPPEAAREALENLKIPTLEIPPIPMLIHCPLCSARHIDRGRFETHPHHTHSCQICGHTWRPAVVHTVGVQFLPGFKDPA